MILYISLALLLNAAMMSRARADAVTTRTPLSSPLIIIEHLEPFTSKWMHIELRSASRLAGPGNLWITNVKSRCEREILASLARVFEESIVDLVRLLEGRRIIVLDPTAKERLSPSDFTGPTAVVVGGIMGAHPPLGRTRSLLTSKLEKLGAAARSLGEGQYTIDGAVYVALRVARGVEVEEIPVIRGLRLKHPEGWSVELPYTYPVEEGRPVISEEEIDYVLYGVEEDEERLLREGVVPSIC